VLVPKGVRRTAIYAPRKNRRSGNFRSGTAAKINSDDLRSIHHPSEPGLQHRADLPKMPPRWSFQALRLVEFE
jgi:hypothetical protein